MKLQEMLFICVDNMFRMFVPVGVLAVNVKRLTMILNGETWPKFTRVGMNTNIPQTAVAAEIKVKKL